ncbi:hypothetical protein D3C79_905310 [compost metagenome]
MSTGHQQGDKRELRRLLFEHRREQMTFHVMHAQRRNTPGKRQGLGAGRPYQQRADQTGAGGIGNGINFGSDTVGLVQHLADQRQHALDVIA